MTASGWVLYFFIMSTTPGTGTQTQEVTAPTPQVFATSESCNHAIGFIAYDLNKYLNSDSIIRAYCVPQTYKGIK